MSYKYSQKSLVPYMFFKEYFGMMKLKMAENIGDRPLRICGYKTYKIIPMSVL